MGIYFVFDARSSEHFASLYLNGCKKHLETVSPSPFRWLEVSIKDYLREDFLISSEKKQLSVFISSDTDTEKAAAKAAFELKKSLNPYPVKIVVYGAEEPVTYRFAGFLANATGAELYIYPLKIESLKGGLADEFTVLTLEEHGKNQVEKLGYKSIATGNFLPPAPTGPRPLPPCPPAAIGVFVDDERSFESFKNLLKAAARIENTRLFLFASAGYASKARDYADLTDNASIVEVYEEPEPETLFFELSRTSFVVSLSSSLLPLDAVFSLCSFRPVLSSEESPAAFIAQKTQGLTIPVIAEENIYDALVRFIERYDLLEFERLEQEARKIASFTAFIEKLESLRQAG